MENVYAETDETKGAYSGCGKEQLGSGEWVKALETPWG
jgi:hypothetical protein